ncbi:hypothetical protein AOR_1_914094 [Paecilomyces variotii No. 5]|uniref:DUF6546 domain-containing protein n=1 Tax=Byssochlamys spectabilis (strain No. 5 / NBRC 109023) TaxID=1356009 RepID=V5G4Q7_BYSSN|nr:hypothetical protein AOR_1_914094 [Paecilomyces variotii No. 5]
METPPYRARFHNDDAFILPKARCINRLVFDDGVQIWPQTAMQIAAHCPTIASLSLRHHEIVHPNHLKFMQERREGLAKGIAHISQSLREFTYEGDFEGPWEDADSPSALTLSPSADDLFSQNIRRLSLHLEQLTLFRTCVSADFLFPLDDEGQPLPNTACLSWPNLRTLTLRLSTWLPSGEWLIKPPRMVIAERIAMGDMDIHTEDLERSVPNYEAVHRMFVSMGCAAHNMPSLRSIEFSFDDGPMFSFSFLVHNDSATATWRSDVQYRPDQRVASAWNFHLDDMLLGEERNIYVDIQWPPDATNTIAR